jgi:putative addiction module killer protein
MVEIRETAVFSVWLRRLGDATAKARIVARVRRLAFGNPGDVQPIGGGLSEMRIHHGPGYRVYFMRRGETLIVLLCGGDKRTQRRDIEAAKTLAQALKE